MTPEEAEASVAQLEAHLRYHLSNMPISLRDQWTTRVRNLLVDMQVDVEDQAQMRGAFAGAYVMANLILPATNIPALQAGAAVGMLRDLLNRSRDSVPPPSYEDLEALLARPWWHEEPAEPPTTEGD